MDGAVHVALGGHVDYSPRTMPGEKPAHQLEIADIATHERVSRASIVSKKGKLIS
jgi:hypothetical protein